MNITWMTSIRPDSCLFPYREKKKRKKKFPGGPVIKNPPVSARDTG